MIAAAAMALTVPTATLAQGAGEPAGRYMKMRWTRMVAEVSDSFLTTAEAARIGDNLLFYQHPTGGWPKNMQLQDTLTAKIRDEIAELKGQERYATIDNGATTAEIRYLARLYGATGDKRYGRAVERGIGYLLEAQYDNGGWPQFYPLSEGYYTHITYNDNAMVNVLRLLQAVSMGEEPFAFVADSIKALAKAAVDRGVDCILKTQVTQDGRPTVWCAQHDEHTLKPANARAYELASLSGAESDGIVMFLMSLPEPSEEVVKCVDNAVAWFKRSKILGIRVENYINADGKRDRRVVECAQDAPCEPLWARFYTLDGNRPFFCDRDGVKRYSLDEVGYERRNGYSWYNSDGTAVIEAYDRWKKNLGR